MQQKTLLAEEETVQINLSWKRTKNLGCRVFTQHLHIKVLLDPSAGQAFQQHSLICIHFTVLTLPKKVPRPHRLSSPRLPAAGITSIPMAWKSCVKSGLHHGLSGCGNILLSNSTCLTSVDLDCDVLSLSSCQLHFDSGVRNAPAADSDVYKTSRRERTPPFYGFYTHHLTFP